MANLTQKLHRAIAAYQAKEFSEAERQCKQLVATKHNFFEALHLLAVVQSLQGKNEMAVANYDRALKLRPDHVDALCNRGNTLHGLGHFKQALASFDRALVLQPNNPDALSNRSATLHMLGRYSEAVSCCDMALKINPEHVRALTNRGNALHEMKRDEDALISYDRALALQPDYPIVLSNKGVALHELTRYDEALASYDRALQLSPQNYEALCNRAVTLNRLQRFEEALAACDQALALHPDYAEAFFNRGLALFEMKRLEESVESYDHAIALRPHYAEAYCNRGLPLQKLGRRDEALASYDRALALRPHYADAYSNRGIVLRELRRFDEALANYDQALAFKPDFVEAHSNRGVTLHELKRFDEALASYDAALKINPQYSDALSNSGTTLHELRRFNEAINKFTQATKIRPDYAEAHYNEALCRMLSGDFERGWEKSEWRWASEEGSKQKRNFLQPLWLGKEEIAGKTLLLHSEQGLGDMIQFCRYAPMVAERGAQVIIETVPPLQLLLESLRGVARVVSRGDILPEFDFHCPLLSLPLAFNTKLETIPGNVPYVSVSQEAIAHWGRRLGPRTGKRIGLVWSGSTIHKNDHNRSLSLASFLPLLDTNASFVCLQKEIRASDTALLTSRREIMYFGEDLHNFSDTAALISNLDLVISVDTSVAHLAGALGKPLWILLPYTPDWRWLVDRDDTPWYPTAHLFRQDSSRMWDPVLPRVNAKLKEFVSNAD